MLRPNAGVGAAVLLMLSLFYLAGCSNSSTGDAAGNAAAYYGLERSEFIALKKAGKTDRDLRKAKLERKFAQLKEQGVVVETTTSERKTKRGH